MRYKADAPDLSVKVRVTWQQPTPLEFQRFLLVEFDTPPQCTAEEWGQARFAPTQDQWDALMKTRKFLTLQVGLGDQYKEWSPQDKALWTAPVFPFNKPKRSIQDGLREADRTRRNPTALSPREALAQVLEQALQQKQEKDGPHTVAKKEAKQSGQWLTIPPSSDGLYSVADAVSIVAKEADEGQWTPSRDWFDDQMNAVRLPFVRNARGWKCLDEPGLQCARKLVKDENDRRALVNYQMHALGKSRRAANKYIDEHAAKGESYADITEKLLPRCGREEA